MAQGEKRENSVLFSLRELRTIEESRVQEEETAVRNADEARSRAQAAEDQRRRNEEDGRIQAERDHHRSIEEAKASAEREARMRVESAEAAERAREQAAFEQQRLAQEMELRRADIAKKRPTWMLVVTGFAIVAAIGLIFFAIQRKNDADEADKQAEIAKKAKDEAVAAAQEAKDRLVKLEKDLDEIQEKVGKAVNDLSVAQNDADRQAARGKLAEAQKEQYEMKQRVATAKAAAERAERNKGVHISDECKNNPLAKGCS